MLRKGLDFLIYNWCQFWHFCLSLLSGLPALPLMMAIYKTMEERLYNTQEIAAYLKVSPHTVRSWVKYRRIPFIKIGRCVRFRLSKVERWLSEKNVIPVLDFHGQT